MCVHAVFVCVGVCVWGSVRRVCGVCEEGVCSVCCVCCVLCVCVVAVHAVFVWVCVWDACVCVRGCARRVCVCV